MRKITYTRVGRTIGQFKSGRSEIIYRHNECFAWMVVPIIKKGTTKVTKAMFSSAYGTPREAYLVAKSWAQRGVRPSRAELQAARAAYALKKIVGTNHPTKITRGRI